MKTSLHIIYEKMQSIQLSLLRYPYEDHKKTLLGRIEVIDEQRLRFTIADEAPMENLLQREVSLVQKDNDNYIYVDGIISAISSSKNPTLTIEVNKACWFIRKRAGSVTSLHQKCVYENELQIAS